MKLLPLFAIGLLLALLCVIVVEVAQRGAGITRCEHSRGASADHSSRAAKRRAAADLPAVGRCE